MSEANVEIVRRIFDAEARGNYRDALAHYDPEIEWDNSRSPVGDFLGTVGGVYRGIGELQNGLRDWYEAWERVDSEVDRLIDAGEDQVVSVLSYKARGRASGVEVEFPHVAGLWTLRDGKVVKVAWMGSAEDALEAAGR